LYSNRVHEIRDVRLQVDPGVRQMHALAEPVSVTG
jgi:hypothetical protein